VKKQISIVIHRVPDRRLEQRNGHEDGVAGSVPTYAGHSIVRCQRPGASGCERRRSTWRRCCGRGDRRVAACSEAQALIAREATHVAPDRERPSSEFLDHAARFLVSVFGNVSNHHARTPRAQTPVPPPGRSAVHVAPSAANACAVVKPILGERHIHALL